MTIDVYLLVGMLPEDSCDTNEYIGRLELGGSLVKIEEDNRLLEFVIQYIGCVTGGVCLKGLTCLVEALDIDRVVNVDGVGSRFSVLGYRGSVAAAQFDQVDIAFRREIKYKLFILFAMFLRLRLRAVLPMVFPCRGAYVCGCVAPGRMLIGHPFGWR